MSRIFWDTNLFIYLLEEYGEHSKKTRALALRMRARNDLLFTSTLSLGEALVKPLERNQTELVARFEEILERHAVMIPFDQEAAKVYALVRRDRSIKIADAIQLASAARERVDLFVTNDERLSQKVIPGIHFISALEKAVQLL